MGDLDDSCMIVALSLMTKKSFDIIAKDLIRISNGRSRTDGSVGIDFINEYSIYFEYGIKKNKKSNCYSKENISLEDYNKMLAKYELLRKKIDSTKSKCN